MQDLEEAIRERAYHLWVMGGRDDGNAEAHWLAAQREVLASSLKDPVAATPGAPRKAARKVKDTPAPSRRKTRAA